MDWYSELTDGNKIAFLMLVVVVIGSIIIPLILHSLKSSNNQLSDATINNIIDALTKKQKAPVEELEFLKQVLHAMQLNQSSHKKNAVSFLEKGDAELAALELELDLNEHKQIHSKATETIVDTLIELSSIYYFSDFQKSLLKLEEAKGIAPNDSRVLNRLALLSIRCGNIEYALSLLNQIKESEIDEWEQNIAEGNLGIAYFRKSNFDEAEFHFKNAVKLSEKNSNSLLLLTNISNLGSLYLRKNNLEEAESYLVRGLELSQRFGHKEAEVNNLVTLGILFIVKQEYEQAILVLLKGLNLANQISYKTGIGSSQVNLGKVYFILKENTKSAYCFEEGYRIARQIGDKHGEVTSLMGLASVKSTQKLYEEAIDFYEQALKISDSSSDEQTSAEIKVSLGLNQIKNGYPGLGKENLISAKSVYEESGLPFDSKADEILKSM